MLIGLYFFFNSKLQGLSGILFRIAKISNVSNYTAAFGGKELEKKVLTISKMAVFFGV